MTQLSLATVDYVVIDNIAWIRLNRPHRLNAVVPQLVEDLCRTLEKADTDRVGAAVLIGKGRAFCSGHDLREERDEEDIARRQRHLQRVQDVTRRIGRSPHPVIAAVHGYALGAGCEFALGSDLVLAAAGAKFGFPEVGVGLTVTGGISHILPRTVGSVRAKELLLLGEYVDAEQAVALGLINRVVSGDSLEAETKSLAERLRDRPRVALTLSKRVLDNGAQSGLATALELEVDHALIAAESRESIAAAESFRQRSSGRAEQARSSTSEVK